MITAKTLRKFDRSYFDEETEDYTEEEAAYRLATWLFDNEDVLTKRKLARMKTLFPPAVYVEALENFLMHNHDT